MNYEFGDVYFTRSDYGEHYLSLILKPDTPLSDSTSLVLIGGDEFYSPQRFTFASYPRQLALRFMDMLKKNLLNKHFIISSELDTSFSFEQDGGHYFLKHMTTEYIHNSSTQLVKDVAQLHDILLEHFDSAQNDDKGILILLLYNIIECRLKLGISVKNRPLFTPFFDGKPPI